jgi:hypothetical protein
MSEGMRLRRVAYLHARNSLILLILRSWLAALDDFRNWLIREAAEIPCNCWLQDGIRNFLVDLIIMIQASGRSVRPPAQ